MPTNTGTNSEEKDYVRVEVRLDLDLAEQLARIHGDVPRATYIRRLIERHVAKHARRRV